MDTYTFRLQPGQDLLEAIEDFVCEKNIFAGCILCAVGSLTHAVLRLANLDSFTHYEGFFEIVAVAGTVSKNGSHIHLAVSDSQGCTIGGHLVPGCLIYTTAEIVLAVFPDVIYRREHCERSGYDELKVVLGEGRL